MLVGAIVMLLVGVIGVGCGQAPEPTGSEAVVQLPDTTGRWHASGEPVVYGTESIFSYIDGHAEVYLAYGMQRCLSRRYASEAGAEVVVDLFELASPADAFGVFTHDRDGEVVDAGHDARLRPGWLSLWYGRWFVSLYHEGGAEPEGGAVVELARGVVAGLPEAGKDRPPTLVQALPSVGLERSTVRFLRTFGILNSHLYMGAEDPFGLGADTAAVLAEYERSGDSAFLLVVELPTLGRAEAAVEGFAASWLSGDAAASVEREDGWYAIDRTDRRVVVVLAASSRHLCERLLADGLESVGSGGTR
jgi:hypothetical protein